MEQSLVSQDRQLVMEILRLRYWQLLINEELKKKAFKVPVHVAIGHEAIAVAVSHSMQEGDQLALSHRNMTYNLIRAGSLRPIYDEYKLLPTGVAQGKLGSQNLANPDRGVVYSSSVLGNNISVACGLALGKQVLQRSGLVIVLTGDGGMEEGAFYEGLVLAKSLKLRMLIIVENNNQSMSSKIEERRCPISLTNLCATVKAPFRSLSGNNVFEYLSALRTVRALAIEQSTPVVMEILLGALNQHAGPTPGWPTDPKNISIENGLVVEQTPNDPVFVLQQKIDPTQFEELAHRVLSEGWRGWDG